MIYVLDTNICIYYLRGDFPQLKQRIEERDSSELAVSTITVAELFYGVHHSSKVEANLGSLSMFLDDLDKLAFDVRAAARFGRLKEDLGRQGKVVGPYDLLIAATVLTLGHTLVTHNVTEFSMIPGLLIEDWTK